jgi:hypothetical protein
VVPHALHLVSPAESQEPQLRHFLKVDFFLSSRWDEEYAINMRQIGPAERKAQM